jgi:hypothetical protein
MVLGSSQRLTEMSTRKPLESKGPSACKVDSHTVNYESIFFQENGYRLLKKYSEVRRYLFNYVFSKLPLI